MSPRLFLDSSVILAASGNPQGGSSKILELVLQKQVILFTSKLALAEAEKNIKEKLPRAVSRFQFILSTVPLNMVEEPAAAFEKKTAKFIYWKDAAILAAAVISKADYLLTFNRKHFFNAKTKNFAKNYHLEIITPGEFLKAKNFL